MIQDKDTNFVRITNKLSQWKDYILKGHTELHYPD